MTFGVYNGTLHNDIPAPVSYAGPLDIVPGAVVAISQRRMAAAFSGNVIRINNGTSTHDYPASTNNAVDPAVIVAFIGGGDSLCAGLFDQSGNGCDILQADPTLQFDWAANVIGSLPGLTTTTAADPNQMILGPSATNSSFASGTATSFVVATKNIIFEANAGSYISHTTGLVGQHADVDLYNTDSNNECGFNIAAANSSGVHIYEAVAQFGASLYLIDGVAQSVGADFDTQGPPEAFLAPYHILNQSSVATTQIFEAFAYDGVISSANRLAIRQNIAAYYGITL